MGDFSSFKERHSRSIETALSDSIAPITEDNRSVLSQAISHSLLNGGKRIRPLLTLASHSLFSTEISSVLPLATALEIK